MKITILNERLRANGGRWEKGDTVEVDGSFEKDATDKGLGGMFEVEKAATSVKGKASIK